MPQEIHNLGPHSLFYKREENRAEENWDCYQGKEKKWPTADWRESSWVSLSPLNQKWKNPFRLTILLTESESEKGFLPVEENLIPLI